MSDKQVLINRLFNALLAGCTFLHSNFRYSCLRQAGLQVVRNCSHNELFVGIVDAFG